MEIQSVSLITNGNVTFSFQNAFTYTQTGGTFVGGAGALSFRNTFLISGGSFTASSGTTIFAAGFQVTGTGSFEHNNGTVLFTRSVDFDVPAFEEFNNVSINSGQANTLVIAPGDTLRILGNLTLDDGDVLGGTLQILGNVTVAPEFDGGSAAIEFSGPNNQNYTNSGGINPNGGWTFDKTGGTVTLGSDLDLSNGTSDFLLANGTITTGPNSVIAGSRSISRTNGFINGRLRRSFVAAGAQRFDVGTIDGYSPATINAPAGTFGAATTLTVAANAGTLPGAAPLQSLTRNWSIDASPGGISNADVRLDYLQGDVPAGANESNFVFLRRSGGTTSVQGISSINVAENFATLNGVSTFSDWTLGVFVPTAAGVVVGGRVLTNSGRGVAFARLTLTDANGITRIALTNPLGFYRFEDVTAGESFVLSVSSKTHEFTVPSVALVANDSLTEVNFDAVVLP